LLFQKTSVNISQTKPKLSLYLLNYAEVRTVYFCYIMPKQHSYLQSWQVESVAN